MAAKAILPNLIPREAIADTLHRCILGLDSNNRPLLESACLKSSEMTFTYGPSANQATLTDWDAINPMFDRVFSLITTHSASNIRVDVKDDNADTARMTAHVISYHVRQEQAFTETDTSYTASSLYDVEVVRDDSDQGLWKIKTWKATMLWTTGDIKVLHP